MKMFGEELSSQEKTQIQEQAKQLEHKLTKVITIAGSRKKVDKIDISKLEIKEIVLEPSDIDRDKYVRLGEEISDKLVYIPSKVYVQRTIRPKYVLKSQLQIENPLEQTFKIASLPNSALKKCMADSSLLTEIIIQKYLYHLPFHRIIQKFRDSGFIISNSTIGDWFAATCVKIRPLYDKLKEDILTSDYIQVDETTLPVISDEKNRAVKGYVWMVDNYQEKDIKLLLPKYWQKEQ